MNTTVSNTGMTFLDVLQIVFIVLKLCGVITWSWKIVLIPLWIELTGLVVVITILLIAKKRGRYL